MQRTQCSLKEMPDLCEKIHDEMHQIPLVVGANEEKGEAAETFWRYASSVTHLPTKQLVGLAMREGKSAAWDRVAISAAGAMKAGNWLVLQGGDGAADLGGIAKECGSEAETTLAAMFEPQTPKEHTQYPALELEIGDVRPEFRVIVTSLFEPDDIEEFLQYGQIPLEKCHMVVVE